MFGSKRPLSSVEIVNSALKSGKYQDRSGALVITHRLNRKSEYTGTLYISDNKVYAATVEPSNLSVLKRAFSTGELSADDYNDMQRKFRNNLNHPQILPFLLSNQLFPDDSAVKIFAEYLLASIEKIFSWESASGTWHEGEKYEDAVIDVELSLEKIDLLLSKRTSFYRSFEHLASYDLGTIDYDNLSFVIRNRLPEKASRDMSTVYKMCQENKSNFAEIIRETGITPYVALQALLRLWKNGALDISQVPSRANEESTHPVVVSYERALECRESGLSARRDAPTSKNPHKEEPVIVASGFSSKDSTSSTHTSHANSTATSQNVVIEGEVIIEGEIVEPRIAQSESPYTHHSKRDATNSGVRLGSPIPMPMYTPSEVTPSKVDDSLPTVEVVSEPLETSVLESGQSPSSTSENSHDQESDNYDSEGALPENSPVYSIHMRLQELGDDKDKEEASLNETQRLLDEQRRKVQDAELKLREAMDFNNKQKNIMETLEKQETTSLDRIASLETQIFDTIATFQYRK